MGYTPPIITQSDITGSNELLPFKQALAPSRRGFLRITGTLSSLGVAGCVGAQEENLPPQVRADTTLIATWRGHDPTSAITLQWLESGEDRTEQSTVSLSPKTEADNEVHRNQTEIAPFADGLSRQRAVLTNLIADTTYEIEIDGSETGYTIKTAPRTLSNQIEFAEGGDIGTSTAVTNLHNHASSWDPLFGLVGGDLAYANGRVSRRWIRFLELWHQYMRSGNRLIPMVAAIGNHEVQSGMHGTPAEAPFFYTLFDNTQREQAYWTLDIGDYLSIIILDSNHTTPVAGQQTDWLVEVLSKRVNRQHLLTAYHVPAYPSAKPLGARDRDDIVQNWVPLFEEYKIDGAFEHDDHTYKRTHLLRDGQPVSKNGVRYVGDGAWGKGPREAKSPEQRPYLQKSASRKHVLQVSLSGDGSQRIKAVGVNGGTFDQFQF